MSAWRRTEQSANPAVTDFASDILWRTATAVAVLDLSGLLAFSNPAFQASGLPVEILDRRGYLGDPQLEHLRALVVRQQSSVEPATAEVATASGVFSVEVLGLGRTPGWTALVATPLSDSHTGPETPSLSMMLHELRTPMLAIREALDQLTQGSSAYGADQLAAISRQSRAVTRMSGLLTGLSDLLHAGEVGSQRTQWPLVDLSEVVGEVADTYSSLAAAAGHDLRVTVPQEPIPLPGDRGLLERAIVNLLDNALKYAPPPGPISLGLHRRGALAVVEVADRGPGVAAEDRERIFDPFVRLVPAPERGAQGSGLGLAVVRAIAAAHGGTLSLESTPGMGSTFRLGFLFARTGQVSLEAAPIRALGPRLQSR